LARDFESCSFIFSSRKTNVVAHKLARCAESSICSISVGVVPELIREELCNDVFWSIKRYILSKKKLGWGDWKSGVLSASASWDMASVGDGGRRIRRTAHDSGAASLLRCRRLHFPADRYRGWSGWWAVSVSRPRSSRVVAIAGGMGGPAWPRILLVVLYWV
jgi:hypothetical protein